VGKDKAELLQGTLDLLVLKTVETMGPIHGWGIAKRIEQISQDLLEMKYGTLYPALMRLEQNGWISSAWGTSENNRRARFYSITKQGRKQLALEAEKWGQMAAFITRVLSSTQ
jgi:PadR family transcriptional regulator, regulatory protein PadR